MTTLNASISVIGAGCTAPHWPLRWPVMAIRCCCGATIRKAAQLQADRCNTAFLPDVPFPDNLVPEADLARVVSASRDLLVVVPSHVFGDVLMQLKPLLRADSRIVWATKGLEKRPDDCCRMWRAKSSATAFRWR